MSVIAAQYTATTQPRQTDFRLHSHTGYEIYCFLKGSASFMVESTRYPLQPGDLLLMCRGESHHLILEAPSDYHRLVVSFEELPGLSPALTASLLRPFHDRPFGKWNLYPAARFAGRDWRRYLDRLCDAADDEQRLCYLLPLLCEIKEAFAAIRPLPSPTQGDPVSPIIAYIDRHLTEPLSLTAVCERFYISKTHINRLFKRATGATVWEYVTVKRLFLARRLLEEGVPPAEACTRSGFGDYTAFFRAYKKRFGVSPRATAG